MMELYVRALLTLTAAATILFAVEPAFAQVKGTASYRDGPESSSATDCCSSPTSTTRS
jgi:hypothetical protein